MSGAKGEHAITGWYDSARQGSKYQPPISLLERDVRHWHCWRPRFTYQRSVGRRTPSTTSMVSARIEQNGQAPETRALRLRLAMRYVRVEPRFAARCAYHAPRLSP